MISLKRFRGTVDKKKTEKNRNKKMVKIIDTLIKCCPEEYEILDDVKIDIVEEIPLSSLKKEKLKKAIKKFKETTKTIKEDKNKSPDFTNIPKIEYEIFVYHIKNVVDALVAESEKLKIDAENSNSGLTITAKNKLQTRCKTVFSEILRVQNELETQTNILKNIQTKMAIIDEQIKGNES
jgi:hypothetical protein